MRTAISLVLAVGAGLSHLSADGGVVIARRETEDVVVTVLAEPVPVRVGRADFSVIVQDARSRAPLVDPDVRLALRPVDVDAARDEWVIVCNSLNGTGTEGRASSVHSNNKLLQSLVLGIPAPGTWSLEANVSVGDREVDLVQKLEVRPAPPPLLAWWPVFALIPAVIGLYALRAALLRRRRERAPVSHSSPGPSAR